MNRYPKLLFYTTSGFTLIELLIAIAIASILVGALFSTYMAIQRAVTQIEESSRKLLEARNLLDMLSKELSSAYLDSNDERTFFKLKDRDVYGKPASFLSFTTFSDRGLINVDYRIKEIEGENRLILTKTAGPAFRKERIEAEMIEDIGGFLIEIPSKDNPLRTWDTELTKRLPEEIKITLILNINQRNIDLSETVIPRLK